MDNNQTISKMTETYGNTNGRQRLRPWLVHKINSGTIKGLEWMDEEKLMFKIPWKHAGKQDYDPEEDSRIFKEWSLHTGKYKTTMEPEPAVWKTRLRTALNKLPDIEEVQDKTQLDIPEPYRVYRLLPRQKKPSMPITPRSTGCRAQAYHPYQRVDQTNLQQPHNRIQPLRHSMSYPRPSNIHTGYATGCIMPGYDQMTPPGNQNDILYEFQSQISPVYASSNSMGLNIDDVNEVITPRLEYIDYDQMSAGSSSPNMDPEQQYQNNNQITQFNYTQGGITSVPTMTSLQSRTPVYGFQNQTTNAYATQTQGCAPTTAVGMTSSPAYSQTYQQTQNAIVPYHGGAMRQTDDVWVGATVPVREDSMIIQTEKEMDVKIRYRGEPVLEKRVGDSGCCIYSKSMEPGSEHLTPIELADSQTFNYKILKPSDKQKEHTNTVIESMFKGLNIEYDESDRSLYVTRHCKGMVFCHSTQFHIGQPAIKLEREKRFKIFDYYKFDNDFSHWYKEDYSSDSRMPIQKPEIFFSVAQKFETQRSVLDTPTEKELLALDDCLVSIIVQPVRANENIEAVDKKNLCDQIPTGIEMKSLLFTNDDQQLVSNNLQYTNGYYPQSYRSYDVYNGNQSHSDTHAQSITQLTP